MVARRSRPRLTLRLRRPRRAGNARGKTGRSSAQMLGCSWPLFPDQNPIHGSVAERHSKHSQCARDHWWTGCGNVEITAPSADDETEDKTNCDLHDSLPSENKCLRADVHTAAMPPAAASDSEIEETSMRAPAKAPQIIARIAATRRCQRGCYPPARPAIVSVNTATAATSRRSSNLKARSPQRRQLESSEAIRPASTALTKSATNATIPVTKLIASRITRSPDICSIRICNPPKVPCN